MDCSLAYSLWRNYKAKKRLITEKKIKGRCELRARHWKLLERSWYDQFATKNPIAQTRGFYIFIKMYPGVKEENLVRIMKSSQYINNLPQEETRFGMVPRGVLNIKYR